MAWLEFFPRLFESEHQRVRRRLSAYLDGDLADSDKAWVEQHLAECSACRRELESLRVTIGLLRELPEVEPPRSFILERVPAPRGIWRWLSYDWAWTSLKGATVLAAVLLMAVVAGDITSQLGLPPAPLLEKPVEKLVTKVVEKEVVETKVVERAVLEEGPKAAEEFAPIPSPEQPPREVPPLVEASPTPESVAAKEAEALEVELVPSATDTKVVREKLVEKKAEVRETPAVEKVEMPKQLAFAPEPSPPPPGAAISAVTVAEDIGAVETVITAEEEPTEVRAFPTTVPPAEVAATPKPEAVPIAAMEEEEAARPEPTGAAQLLKDRLWRWLEAGALAALLALGGFLWMAKRQRDALHL